MNQAIKDTLTELKQATATELINAMSSKGYDTLSVAYSLQDMVFAGKLRVSGSYRLSVR